MVIFLFFVVAALRCLPLFNEIIWNLIWSGVMSEICSFSMCLSLDVLLFRFVFCFFFRCCVSFISVAVCDIVYATLFGFEVLCAQKAKIMKTLLRLVNTIHSMVDTHSHKMTRQIILSYFSVVVRFYCSHFIFFYSSFLLSDISTLTLHNDISKVRVSSESYATNSKTRVWQYQKLTFSVQVISLLRQLFFFCCDWNCFVAFF